MNLAGQIQQSVNVLRELTDPLIEGDQKIPIDILKRAKGIVFLSQIKAGFLWSGMVGAGIIIKRLDGGRWSAPSSVGTTGVGFGLQIGAQKTDTIIVLNDEQSVKSFSGNGQLKFGGDVAISAGPVGRTLSADARVGDKGVAGCFSYSHSQGLFAGLSMEGAVMIARHKDNREFYCRDDISVEDILNGLVDPPQEAVVLYRTLNELIDGAGGTNPPQRTSNANQAIPPPPPKRRPGGTGTNILPPGWVAHTTKEGEVYYHNKNTDQTQWEFPSNDSI